MKNHKQILTTGDVARICQVAPRTVSKWFDSGRLKGYRVPGSKDRRVPVSDLIKFMKSHGMPLNGLQSDQSRILVVSPDRYLRESMLAALQRRGRDECVVAESAFGAGVTAARFKPSLVFVDVEMPGLCSQGLRDTVAEKGDPSVRIVALASEGTPPESLRQAGYDGCLVRPIDAERLAGILDEMLAAVRP